MTFNSDISDIMNKDISIIGRSVISGAMEILIPSRVPCLIVSVNTSVIRGPGVSPAPSPNIMPAKIYESSVVMKVGVLYDNPVEIKGKSNSDKVKVLGFDILKSYKKLRF